jgi:hypothetical protein
MWCYCCQAALLLYCLVVPKGEQMFVLSRVTRCHSTSFLAENVAVERLKCRAADNVQFQGSRWRETSRVTIQCLCLLQ